MLEQDTLSATTPPDDDDRLSGLDVECDPIEHLLRAKALFQITHFDHGARIRPTNSVRKKLLIRMVIDEITTACVVARPTPSAPSPQFNPLKHAMSEIASPKKTALTSPPHIWFGTVYFSMFDQV